MQDRFNTAAGWILFSGIVALGSSIASGMYFQADKPHRPHHMGYPIAGVAEGPVEEGPALATLLASGDAAKGASSFAKCTTCHTIEQGGAGGIGPNLFGVVGKPIGSHAPGFAYSSDLAGHGGDWSYENLDAWLKNPKAFAGPGTKMSFAGLGNAQERADLILYLRDNGGGPELPAPPAAEAPAEGEAVAEAAPAPEEPAAGGE